LTNLPDHSAQPNVVTVLAISPDNEDHTSLRHIFSHTRWQIFEARNREEARSFLRQKPVGVLVCESDLPDVDWRDLLEDLSGSPASPLLIVTSRHADDALWAEALNLGAYDVVAKPFDGAEVTRIVSLAWLHWKEELTGARKRPERDDPDVGGRPAKSANA
jgi:DNA-binding NtrC family response regulator